MTSENDQQTEGLVVVLPERCHQRARLATPRSGKHPGYGQAGDDTELLRQVSELAVRLMAGPPEADVYAVMAGGLQAITGALAVGISTYDADTGDLVIEHIAADAETLSTVDRLLGHSLVGMRMPVDRESRRQLLADLIQIADMPDTVFGVVPHATSAEIQEALHIDHFVGLVLCFGDEMIGRAVLVMPEGQPSLSREALQILAYIAAAALRRKQMEGTMQELREAQANLIQAAKMAAIGELAAGVAHQINTPLTSVLGFSELLLERTAEDDPAQEQLEAIVRQAGRAHDTVRGLLDFSRQAGSHPEPAGINHILQETLALVRRRLELQGIELQESYAGGLPDLVVDIPRLKQAFLNVITNALYAMPEAGTLSIRTEQVAGEVRVHISDTGAGIPEADLARIFEPFFTTKPAGEGVGLGLSVGLGIVQDHGGRIQVESHQNQGTTVTILLPVD